MLPRPGRFDIGALTQIDPATAALAARVWDGMARDSVVHTLRADPKTGTSFVPLLTASRERRAGDHR
jgi:hypothetical protein